MNCDPYYGSMIFGDLQWEALNEEKDMYTDVNSEEEFDKGEFLNMEIEQPLEEKLLNLSIDCKDKAEKVIKKCVCM